jgi:hypothetical protein
MNRWPFALSVDRVSSDIVFAQLKGFVYENYIYHYRMSTGFCNCRLCVKFHTKQFDQSIGFSARDHEFGETYQGNQVLSGT